MAAQFSINDLNSFSNDISLQLDELDKYSNIVFINGKHKNKKIEAIKEVSKIFVYFLSIQDCPEGLRPDRNRYALIANRLRYALNDYYTRRIFSQMFKKREYKANAECKKLLFNKSFNDIRQIKIYQKIKGIHSELFKIKKEDVEYSSVIRLYRILISENFNKPIFCELKPNEITAKKVMLLIKNLLERRDLIQKEATILDLENMTSAYNLHFVLRRGLNIQKSFDLPFIFFRFEVASPEERKAILEKFKSGEDKAVSSKEILDLIESENNKA